MFFVVKVCQNNWKFLLLLMVEEVMTIQKIVDINYMFRQVLCIKFRKCFTSITHVGKPEPTFFLCESVISAFMLICW